jgi:2',3'-cyclic-nucleotide 2'-phosphodiesterase (5'-nucleotidase family)
VRLGSPNLKGAKVESPVETAKRLVPGLRGKADVVVAATHLGVPHDVALAQNVGGIDVILGGHTHTKLADGLRVPGADGWSTLVAQAHEHLNYLGAVTLELEASGDGWRVVRSAARLIALDQDVPQDPKAKAILAEIADEIAQPAGAK